MAFVASNILAGAGTFLTRLTAARAALLDGLTAARGTLLDNLSRLNGKIAPTQYVTVTNKITTSGFNNVKGQWVELFASTPFETILMIVSLHASHGAQKIDIGTGAAGSETVLIADIASGQLLQNKTYQTNIPLPLKLAAGTRLLARSSTAATVGTVPTVEVGVTLSG